jgi:hypothetical protein
MTVLRELVRLELVILVACCAIVMGLKMLRGAMRRAGPPGTSEARPDGRMGAVRFQMLALSLAIAVLYLIQLPQAAASGRLPPVPEYALALLAGSQFVFLVTMAGRLLRRSGVSKNEGEK